MFLGLKPYDITDHEAFGGRDDEVKKLSKHLLEERNFLLLHGESGIGKTSLIKAGLYPVLIRNLYQPIFVRLGLTGGKYGGRLLSSIRAQINAQIIEGNKHISDRESLNDFLNSNPIADGNIQIVLIFDQFEEIFKIYGDPGDERDVAHRSVEVDEFMDELLPIMDVGAMIGSKRHPKVVLSIREDYMEFLPNIFSHFSPPQKDMVQITHLKGENAISAIEKPARVQFPNFNLSSDVGKAILKEVSENRFSYHPYAVRGTGDVLMERPIKPILLSFYCSELSKRCSPNNFSLDLIKNYPLQPLFTNYYKKTVQNTNKIHPCVRKAVEEKLVTENGLRHSLHIDNFRPDGSSEKWDLAIKELVDSRIVFINGDTRTSSYIELIHDVLAPVVYRYKSIRKSQELRKKRNDLIYLEKSEKQRKVRHTQRWAGALIAFAFLISVVLFLLSERTKSHLLIAENEQATYASFALATLDRNATDQNEKISLIQILWKIAINNKNIKIDKDQFRATLLLSYYRERYYKSIQKSRAKIYGTCLNRQDESVISSSTYGEIVKTALSGDAIWSINLPATYKGHGAPVTAMAVSESTSLCAVASLREKRDGSCKVYLCDYGNGKLTDSFDMAGHNWVNSIAFSPDPNYLICGIKFGEYRFAILDLKSGKVSPVLDENSHDGYVNAIRMMDSFVYTAGHDHTVKKWSFESGQLIFEQNLFIGDDAIWDCEVSMDQQQLLIAQEDGPALLKNIEQDTVLTLDAHHRVRAVGFSENGEYLITGGKEGTTKLWHRSGDLLQEFSGLYSATVWEALLTPKNDFVITAGQDSCVKKWSTSGKMRYRLPDDAALFRSAFSEKKPSDAENALSSHCIPNADERVTTKAFHPEKLAMVMASTNRNDGKTGKLYVCGDTTSTVQSVYTFEKSHEYGTTLCYSPKGDILAVGTSKGQVLLFSTHKPNTLVLKMANREKHNASKFINDLVFSEDGSKLLSGSDDGTAVLWDVAQGTVIKRLSPYLPLDGVEAVALSPNDSFAVLIHSSSTAYLWNLNSGFLIQEIGVLNDPENWAEAAVFSDDSKTVSVRYKYNGIERAWEVREPLRAFLAKKEFDGLTEAQKKRFNISD